ncbi:MAG: hypothetical protein K2Q09_07885 [Phycisphaerales bacterium]|nr:hypothetical protein [Phycisphaerales bacterium]
MNIDQMRLGAVAVCCCLAGTVLGGVDTPPPWTGTGIVGNSSHWNWDFAANSTAPFVGVGYGPPNAQPPIVTGGTWAPGMGADGAWVLLPGESITIDMANFPIPNDFKLMWVQYHVFGLPGTPPLQPPLIQVDSGGVIGQPYGTPTSTLTPDGGLIGAQGFRFPFNPAFEVFRITNNGQSPMFFEWLTIDTICSPTPGAGAALALGSAVLMRRRRR